MLGVEGQAKEGINFVVHTTNNRGFTPEELAERALGKLIHISSTADEQIKAQAIVFKEQLRQVLVFYMNEAIKSDRTTLCAELNKQGHAELADIISKL
jgi:hypothetical protein